MLKASHVLSAACLLAATFAIPAQAAIVENNGTYTVESPPVTPSVSVPLYMNKADSVTSGTAYYGANDPGLAGFPTFSITTDKVVDIASGVAQVTGPGNATFNSLTLTVNNSGGSNWLFHDILFSTQFAKFPTEKIGTGKDAITVTTMDFKILVNGTQQFSFNSGLDDNALTNWLLFQNSGATITSITLTSETGFKSIKFLEISGLLNRGDDPGDVPLPAALVLFGSVLVGGTGLAAVRRRRKFAA